MIPACTQYVGTYHLGPVVLKTLSACDPWAVPHILNPLFAGIWTRTWWFAFFVSGIGELIEYSALTAYQSFVIFLGTHKGVDFNQDIENLAGSYVDDWLFQGGIGTLLAWIFINHFTYPALIRIQDLWNGQALRFIFYNAFLFIGCIVIPSSFFGITVGNDDYPLGRHLYYIIHLVMFLLVILFQPRHVFAGYKRSDIMQFWGIMWFISFILNLQNTWDWFFSSHVQSWLVVGIMLVIVFPWSIYRWRWPNRVRTSFTFKWNDFKHKY